MKAETLYDQSAKHWKRDTANCLSDFTGRPPLLRLCGDLQQKWVLDLGCGEGYCTRRLKALGAMSLIGLDISKQMILMAQQAEDENPMGITYLQGSAVDYPLTPDSFDLVFSAFMFNYLTLEETYLSLSQSFRALKVGGELIFSVPHPFFPFVCDKGEPFYFNPNHRGYFSGRDHMFCGEIWRLDGHAHQVQLRHKTLTDYFQGLAMAGFRHFPEIHELKVEPEHHQIDPDFFQAVQDKPLHLVIKVRK